MEGLPKALPGATIFGFITSARPNGDGGYEVSSLAKIAVSISGPESKTVTPDSQGTFRADRLGSPLRIELEERGDCRETCGGVWLAPPRAAAGACH